MSTYGNCPKCGETEIEWLCRQGPPIRYFCGTVIDYKGTVIQSERCLVREQKVEIERLNRDLQAAYQQLAYLWETAGSCPCGARKESPSTHPHVFSCPTAEACRIAAIALDNPQRETKE